MIGCSLYNFLFSVAATEIHFMLIKSLIATVRLYRSGLFSGVPSTFLTAIRIARNAFSTSLEVCPAFTASIAVFAKKTQSSGWRWSCSFILPSCSRIPFLLIALAVALSSFQRTSGSVIAGLFFTRTIPSNIYLALSCARRLVTSYAVKSASIFGLPRFLFSLLPIDTPPLCRYFITK